MIARPLARLLQNPIGSPRPGVVVKGVNIQFNVADTVFEKLFLNPLRRQRAKLRPGMLAAVHADAISHHHVSSSLGAR